MKTNHAIVPGAVFHHLTVLEETSQRKNRYTVFRCQCECGAIVFASSKDLKRGTVKGCPDCTPKIAPYLYDLTGQDFGELHVIGLAPEPAGGPRSWVCSCSCGRTVTLATTQLVTEGYRCCSKTKHGFLNGGLDLRGRQFGQLTVIQKLDERDSKGSVMWLCRCSCGNEHKYSADMLTGNRIVSCGCYRDNVIRKQVSQARHLVDGTCVEALFRKTRSDNTSGIPGVYRTANGKWRASITFKGKRFELGTYQDKQQAIAARKNGEHMHLDFLDDYYRLHPKQGKGIKAENTALFGQKRVPDQD